MSAPEHVIREPLSKVAGAISRRAGGASSPDIAQVPSPRAALFKALFGSVVFGPLLTAVPLALCLSLFPNVALNASWDGSWAAVLNQAHANHWQFGTDIVFPYGPLGYLMSPYFWPSTFWVRLVFNGVLNLVVTGSVCLLAWRLSPWWRLLAIGAFVLIAANIEYGVPDFLLNVGLLSLGLLCLFSPRQSVASHAGGLVLLAAFAALAKFSAMITAGLTVLVVATHLVLSGQSKAALAISLGWLSAVLLGWMILGQKLSHLPAYLAHGFALSSGYQQAMGLEPTASVWVCALVVAVFAVSLVVMAYMFDSRDVPAAQRVSRLLQSLWLFALLFLTWKHGLVRADKHHVVYFAGFIAVLAPLLQIMPSPCEKLRLARSGLTIAACTVALAALQFSFEPEYVDVCKPMVQFARNINALISPGAYFATMNAELKAQQAVARLPRLRELVGTRTVDVFGNNQASAILNGMNLRPRPVFQSYAAYNESLMRLNERYYLSSAAPEFVLLCLDPIDGRFPPLEDGRLLRLLESRYSLAVSDGRFILLRNRALGADRKATPETALAKTTLLKEGVMPAGARLDISSFGTTNLWLELIAEPTLLGRLRQFCYRQAPLKLWVWNGSEKDPQEFNAPAPMLTAGFIASPLLLQTTDVAAACDRRELGRPTTFGLQLGNEGQRWWKDNIRYRISRMESE